MNLLAAAIPEILGNLGAGLLVALAAWGAKKIRARVRPAPSADEQRPI